jgi:hypothetical protein
VDDDRNLATTLSHGLYKAMVIEYFVFKIVESTDVYENNRPLA